jgi:hypothetical protein
VFFLIELATRKTASVLMVAESRAASAQVDCFATTIGGQRELRGDRVES